MAAAAQLNHTTTISSHTMAALLQRGHSITRSSTTAMVARQLDQPITHNGTTAAMVKLAGSRSLRNGSTHSGNKLTQTIPFQLLRRQATHTDHSQRQHMGDSIRVILTVSSVVED
jgi:hypothetical protein